MCIGNAIFQHPRLNTDVQSLFGPYTVFLPRVQEKIQRRSSQNTTVVDDRHAIKGGRVPYVLGEFDSFLGTVVVPAHSWFQGLAPQECC
jgi:hypothetical protein